MPEGFWRAPFLAATASLFNMGWAAVQVSHMALLPCLHRCPVERTRLQSAVYGSTVCSNLELFLLFYVCSRLRPEGPWGLIVIGVMVIGIPTTFWFHCMVRERCRGTRVASESHLTPSADSLAEVASPLGSPPVARMPLLAWFAMPELWACGACYMMTRIVVNISQTYMAFLLLNTLGARPKCPPQMLASNARPNTSDAPAPPLAPFLPQP